MQRRDWALHHQTLADRAALNVLSHTGRQVDVVDFFPDGSDERQYCSPGFNLAMGLIMRTMYGRYPEYHTSLDNKDIILKRGCTEMEFKFGDSNIWGMSALERAEQEEICSKLQQTTKPIDVTFLHDVKLRRWAEFAHGIGDFTYADYIPGLENGRLYPDYRKY